MIVSLFLPEHIGTYQLFKKRVLCIEITPHVVYATRMELSGTSRSVLEAEQEAIDPEKPYDEAVVTALESIIGRCGPYDEARCVLPSSLVIFKELVMPFIGRNKISLVVPFEIEAQLPFTLDEGIVTNVVTKEDHETKTSTVLIAAAKHDTIARFTKYCTDAGIALDVMSVDILEQYGMLSQHALVADGVTALIEATEGETTLGLIVDERLAYVRNFKGGLSQKVLDQISLTIDSVTSSAGYAPLKHVLITGSVTDTAQDDVRTTWQEQFGVPVTLVTPAWLHEHKVVHNMPPDVPGAYISTIALGLPRVVTDEVTFLQAQAEERIDAQINYQIVAALILLAGLFSGFVMYSMTRVSTLKKAYRVREQEAITALKKHFTLKPPQLKSLETANKAAQNELTKRETAWRRLSPANRYAYLKNLAGLSNCISLQDTQIQIDSIILKDDTIKLYGQVPGYQQLTKLQDQLACPFFEKVPKLQAFNFKSEPITLVVSKEDG